MTAPPALSVVLRQFARDALSSDAASEHVATTVERLDGFRNQATTAHGFTIVLDEPVAMGGSGSAADPAEYLLTAVGASLSVTLTVHAALRDIAVTGLRIELAATMDAKAFFEPGVGTTGLVESRIRLIVQSDAPEADLRSLIDDALAVAPVLKALRTAPAVDIHIERTG